MQRLVHEYRHFARLLQPQPDGRAKVHVDLAGFDTREKIAPKKRHENDRYQRNYHKPEDEAPAARERLGEEFPIAHAEALEALLKTRVKPAEEALRFITRLAFGDLRAQQIGGHRRHQRA